MPDFYALLAGGDLRMLGRSETIARLVKSQADFDALFEYLHHDDRLVVMRAADIVEKISCQHPQYLKQHKAEILRLCRTATNKELLWHLAQLAPRLQLNQKELKEVWEWLSGLALDTGSSRIVRVNALQAMHELSQGRSELAEKLQPIIATVVAENIPSINARIRRWQTDGS